ncbi:MAG: TonB-dependent receptor [Bacteroidales bacterium]|nr:TonB-dependent receptor [Bacteroidales bacterium]
MKRVSILLSMIIITINTLYAQHISITFDDTKLSEALRIINGKQSEYTINFLYDDLEDFRITTAINRKSVPDAISQMIAFYPIRMTINDNKEIYVECIQKSSCRLTGLIIDENNLPIAYANVALLSVGDSTLTAGGISNETGHFAIPYSGGKVIVKISFIGYKTYFQLTDGNDLDTVRLVPEVVEIDGVVITGRRDVIKSETDRLQYIVSADQFANGLTAKELTRRVPMLTVSENNVSIVGKSATHFLLDGRLLPDEMAASKLNTLKSEDIERIEVITIPPAKFKAEANAGYVNIVLRKDQTLGLRGDLTEAVYFKEHINSNLTSSLNYATRKLDLSFSGGLSNTKGSNDHTQTTVFKTHERHSEYVRKFDWGIYNANILAKYQLTDRSNFGLLGALSTSRIKINQHDVTREKNIETITDMTSPKPDNYNLSAELFYDLTLDSTGKMMSLTYDYLNNYACQDERLTSENQNITTTGACRYRIDGWKVDFGLPFSSIFIETGLHYTQINNNSDVNILRSQDDNLSNEYNYTEQTAAAYVSAWRQLSKKISIKAGLRVEKTWTSGRQVSIGESNSDNYIYLFPSVHFGWQATDKIHLGAAYSKGISRPDFQSLNPFRYYMTPNNYFAGNPYLTPGVTDNMEINFNNSRGLYAVIYESHQKNAPGTTTSFSAAGVQCTTIENCFSSDKAGLYVSWQKNIFDWWSINLGGEIFYSQCVTTGKSTPIKNLYLWSGKSENGTYFFLNHNHTLVLSVNYTHYFPYVEMNTKQKSLVLFYSQLRYSAFNNHLRLTLSVSDPFRQNITRAISHYADYSIYASNYIHPHSVTLAASWSFGGEKVRRFYRQSKNTEAKRAEMR